MNDPTVDIKKFNGLRNTEQSRRLEPGSLEVAENIDIDDTGGIVRRRGFVASKALSNVRGSFSPIAGDRLFIIEGSDLKLVRNDLSIEVLAPDIPSHYIHWEEVADFVLLSSGHVIDADNNVSSWRVPVPVGISAAGNNGSGLYQVAATYIDEVTGREGGVSEVITVYSDSTPVVSVPALLGYRVITYISEAGGSVLLDSSGVPIDEAQLRCGALPEGISCIAYFSGHVFVAVAGAENSVLYGSEPYWWNLFDLEAGFIPIPGKIVALVALEDGLVIATNKEIYVYSREEALHLVADYGVPEGVPYSKTDDGKIYMWTNQGLCSFFPFKNLTEKKVSVAPGHTVHLQLVEKDGMQKVIVLSDGEGDIDNALS